MAELRENQEIEVELYVEKGVGKTHAKWSPVSTAFYKLMPKIELQENAPVELKDICPMGVFDIEESGKGKSKKVVVAQPLNCTTCRECLRHESTQKFVQLKKIRDHFICKPLWFSSKL